MRKTTIDKIEKEIDEKTKLPKEVKDKIKKEVFINIAIASAIILYFIIIILGSIGTIKNTRIIDLNIFSMIFLGIAIIFFETAYKKDNGKTAIFGIEFLAIAIFTLFLPYIIFELNATNKKYYLMASIYIATYYIVKSIFISIKTKNEYMDSNISDVKEIVKKEKTKRKIKENLEEVEEIKNIKNEVATKTHDKEKTIKKTQKNAPKKVKKEESENKTKEENVLKKRERPKKTETELKESKTNEETTPKKRGRPRKVASK